MKSGPANKSQDTFKSQDTLQEDGIKHNHHKINDAIDALYYTINHAEELLAKINGEPNPMAGTATENVAQPFLAGTLKSTPDRLMEIKEIITDRLNKIEKELF